MRSFLGGVAVAGGAFFWLHRSDLAFPVWGAGAAGMGYALIGWAVGECVAQRWRPGRLVHVLLAVLAAAVWAAAWLAAPHSALGLVSAYMSLAGLVLLGLLFGGRPGFGANRIALVGGMTAGLVAVSAGLPGLIGDGPTMMAFVAVGVVAALVVPRSADTGGQGEAIEKSAVLTFSRVCLALAVGVVGAALLRTYTFSAGWLAYAASDLGIAFCVGLLVRSLLLRGTQPRPVLSLFARGLLLLAIAVLIQSSFLLYPDLIFSEAAVMQTARSLLVPERVFPLWFFAAALAFLVPSGCIARDRRTGRPFSYVALVAAVGTFASLLTLAGVSPAWQYVIAASLCMLALAPLCCIRQRRAQLGSVALPVVGGGLAVCALAWTLVASTHPNWRPLKATFASYLKDADDRFNYSPPAPWRGEGNAPPSPVAPGDVSVESVSFGSWGLEATVKAGDEAGRFTGGNLVSSTRGPDSCAVRLAAALASTHLEPGILLHALEPTPCPTSAVSIEFLTAMRRSLGEAGAFSFWLPTRTVEPDELRRVLATVLAVFDRVRLFTCRDELVLICGGSGKLNYARLRAIFRDPSGAAYMNEGGFWDPPQVLACYTADEEDLKQLAADARPYSICRPSRPPVLARNLAAPSRADTMAVVMQYRLSAARKLPGLLEFNSDNERELALAGLDQLYVERTDALMSRIGDIARAGLERGAPLLSALYGRSINLDLFAPDAERRALKLAVAMHTFGLDGEALKVLDGTTWRDAERFGALYWRARVLESLKRLPEAADAYEAAVHAGTPDAAPHYTDALVRLARIRFGQGQIDKAVECLEQVLKSDEHNVEALVFLSMLYGETKRYEEAAQLAARALEIEPGSIAAREQLFLYSMRAGIRPNHGQE